MRKNKTKRFLYKVDKQLYAKVKEILKYKKMPSISKMIREILNQDFIITNTFNDNFALWLYSQNIHKFKNTESHYISLNINEINILNQIGIKYGINASEIITKLIVFIYKNNLHTVEMEFVQSLPSRYRDTMDDITFYIKIDKDCYDIIKSSEKYRNFKKTELIIDLIDNANYRIEKDVISLLREFSGYAEKSSTSERIVLKIPLKILYFRRLLKNAYSIGETPYSLFHKIVYTKTLGELN